MSAGRQYDMQVFRPRAYQDYSIFRQSKSRPHRRILLLCSLVLAGTLVIAITFSQV